MEFLFVLVSIVTIVVLYFCSKNFLQKYFTEIYQKTHYNPVSTFLQIVGFLVFFSPILISLSCNGELPAIILVPTICILISILFISNFKMQNIKDIIFVTFAQLFYGLLFFVRFVIWIFAIIALICDHVFYGERSSIDYSPFIITSIKDEEMKFKATKFHFTMAGNGHGSLSNLNVYTEPVNQSRKMAEVAQIENELSELEKERNEALIYGYDDIVEYDQKERDLRDELEKLTKE